MKAFVYGAVAALLLAAPATQAAAKSIKIDASGTVQWGSDSSGIFGAGSNLAGQAFSFTATLDLAGAEYLHSGFRTDIMGGESYSYLPGPTPPSLGNAVITIAGVDRAITANWNTTLTAFNGSGFNHSTANFQQRNQIGGHLFNQGVLFAVYPGFGLFDLATYTPPAGNLCGAGHTCNTSNFSFQESLNGVILNSAFAQLNPTSLTMTELKDPTGPGGDPGAVPEPATWALLIGGFGLAGGALRRRRQTAMA